MATFTLGTGGIVQPNAQKMTTAGSYIDFRATATAGWHNNTYQNYMNQK